MIKAIFFDMGGVICEEGFRRGVAQYEKEHKIPAGEFYKAIHDHQGWKDFTLGVISEEEYLAICKRHAGQLPFDGRRYIDLVYELTEPNFTLIQYIKELAKKVGVGIISNHPREWYEHFAQSTGLAGVIKWEVVSGFVHIRKPDRRIFLFASDVSKAVPDEMIYIDDRQEILDGIEVDGLRKILFDGDLEKLKKTIDNLLIN